MSLTQKACEQIRRAIVTGGFEFGERLSEVQVARALGMSKAPVRAAFIELRDMGLVTIVPQAGTYVFTPTSGDVAEMSGFRAMLEDEALRMAMDFAPEAVTRGLTSAIERMTEAIDTDKWHLYSEADSAFHMVLLQQAGNKYLEKAYGLTATALEALRARLQSGEGDFWKRSYSEHIQIRDALAVGDVESVRPILREHILIINRSLEIPGDHLQERDKSRRRSDEEYADLLAPIR